MTPAEIHQHMQQLTQALLVHYDLSEATTISRIAAEEIFGKKAMRMEMEITAQQEKLWHELTTKLISGMPLQYALERAWFMDLTLYVTQDVLIPRPETEELVENIIQQNRLVSPRILDIGTGSGCIALALKKGIPAAQVFACDISEAALQVAKLNAQSSALDIHFFQTDILSDAPLQTDTDFDILVSNPPYIHPAEKVDMHNHVVQYEPHLALFAPAHDMLLFYRIIAEKSKSVLNGRLWFEVHAGTGEQVVEILRDKGFQDIALIRDMQHKNRFVTGRWST